MSDPQLVPTNHDFDLQNDFDGNMKAGRDLTAAKQP